MAGFAFYALVGLLLLVPLEIFLLILAALLIRRRGFVPRAAVPSLKGVERYGWEDFLKLPHREGKPSRRNTAIVIAIVTFLLVLIVLLPGWFLVSRPFFPELSGQPSNYTAPIPVVEANDTGGGGMPLSIVFPRLNVTAPQLNLSGVLAPLKSSLRGVALGIAAILVALSVLAFVIARRTPVVAGRAGQAAEKRARREAAEKETKALKLSRVFSIFVKLRGYAVPAVAFLLLVVIAVIAYLLRSRVRGLAGDVLSFAVLTREFAAAYRFYILAGFVVLAVLLIMLRYLSKRSQKPL